MEKLSQIKPTLFLLLLVCSLSVTVQCQQQLDPPSPSPSPDNSDPTKFATSHKRIVLSVILGALTGFFAAIFCLVLVRLSTLYMNTTPILKGPVVFSLEINRKTLQASLSNLTHQLGGTYYRTTLENGLTIAVKRLQEPFNHPPQKNSKSVERKIQRELQKLSSLKHHNVMVLRAYIRQPERFYLVYDYASTGNLEEAMNRVRENQMELSWEVRLRIAVGVIKGLHYLHCVCIPQILHFNLKPTNVILDSEFEPRLADSGLGLLIPNMDRASSCYTPPECLQDSRYTDKSDIFSFGMILALLLTGRDPTDVWFIEESTGGSLGRWLRHLQQTGETRAALDKNILGEEFEEDEMVMAVRIAIKCLSDMPEDRPCSDQLVHTLTQLHSF